MIHGNVKNPCESMISTLRFCKVEGYRGLAQLAVKVEADLIRRRNNRHQDLTDGLDL